MTRKVNIRLDTTSFNSCEFESLFTGMETKEVVTVKIQYGGFQVSIPSVQAIPKYQKAFNNAASAISKTLLDTSLLVSKPGLDGVKTVKYIQVSAK